MRDSGFTVDGPMRYEPGGPMILEVGFDPRDRLMLLARGITPEIDEAWSDANQQCQAQWYFLVEQSYLAQVAPSEKERLDWLERAWACGADRGMVLSEPPTESEALDAVALGCRPWDP